MYAIVNCCDNYHLFAYHTLLTYEKLWPDNPFIFRIPWNKTKPEYIQEHFGSKVELIKTKKSFKETIFTLVKDLDENSWIYWCSSDTYVDKIEKEKANVSHQYIKTLHDPGIYGLSTCKTVYKLKKDKKPTSFQDIIIYERINEAYHKTTQVWTHQYYRVKVLKLIFDSFEEPKKNVKELDIQLMAENNPLYAKLAKGTFLAVGHHYGLLRLGENTARGKITLNCLNNFKKYNLKKPDNFEIRDVNLFYGRIL